MIVTCYFPLLQFLFNHYWAGYVSYNFNLFLEKLNVRKSAFLERKNNEASLILFEIIIFCYCFFLFITRIYCSTIVNKLNFKKKKKFRIPCKIESFDSTTTAQRLLLAAILNQNTPHQMPVKLNFGQMLIKNLLERCHRLLCFTLLCLVFCGAVNALCGCILSSCVWCHMIILFTYNLVAINPLKTVAFPQYCYSSIISSNKIGNRSNYE